MINYCKKVQSFKFEKNENFYKLHILHDALYRSNQEDGGLCIQA